MPAPRFACLPWYELPETRAAQDALWTIVARHLRRHGIDNTPSHLTRGRSVAELLADPLLLLGQCCGHDTIYGFADCLTVLATPRYAADGCAGADYCSFVLVPADAPARTLDDLGGATCVVNGFNSHSGTNALRAMVAPLSRNGRFFGTVKVSGAHTDSLTMLLAGEADVMAMDCVVHALLSRHRPQALTGTRILCRSEAAPAPPFVTSRTTDAASIAPIRAALADAFADGDAADPLQTLLLDGVVFRPATDYARIVAIEAAALARGYFELHATSPALMRVNSTR
jgi:ABC-type phosphate/phosphonate transport system substrate-binding protein